LPTGDSSLARAETAKSKIPAKNTKAVKVFLKWTPDMFISLVLKDWSVGVLE
jgi:hypothetical protein